MQRATVGKVLIILGIAGLIGTYAMSQLVFRSWGGSEGFCHREGALDGLQFDGFLGDEDEIIVERSIIPFGVNCVYRNSTKELVVFRDQGTFAVALFGALIISGVAVVIPRAKRSE